MKVTLELKIEINVNPNQSHWDGASEHEREIYLREQMQDYIECNLDGILNNVKSVK